MNSAKFALVIATKMKADTDLTEGRSYHTFLGNIRHHTPPLEGIEAISENVWQIDLSNGLYALSQIISEARGWQVPVRVLFFEHSPHWSKHPPEKQV